MTSDISLFEQYQRSSDAEAFSALVRRHAGLVFGVALRITHNRHDAEDITQTCFVELSRTKERITTSVASWLHHMAQWRAFNLIRQSSRRRDRETNVMAEGDVSARDPLWEQAEPLIDKAVAELPAELRAPMVLSYLEGKGQAETAEQLGISQSAVSRRLEKGIEELRHRLKEAGIEYEHSALCGLLLANCVSEAPQELLLHLGKIALLGPATSVSPSAGKSWLSANGPAIGVGVVCVAVAGAIAVAMLNLKPADNQPQTAALAPGKALPSAPNFVASPQHPIGWRNNWTGHFPGATPPLTWYRKIKGFSSDYWYQARKPSGERGSASHPLEYFTIKDWLIAGPFEGDIEQDYVGRESEIQPDEGDKAGNTAWKRHRANAETQSRRDFNLGSSAEFWVDFVYMYGKVTKEPGHGPQVTGDLSNKTAYAHTYIYAAKDGPVGLVIHQNTKAVKVWVNGKPFEFPASKNLNDYGPSVEVSLNKGWNRVMVKLSCDAGFKSNPASGFSPIWRFAAYLRPAGGIVRDGITRSHFMAKDADISYETKNIAWMTKLTGRSMSQPIVVGDRVFVGSNISDLICLDKKTGKVLWLRSNSIWDSLTPAERDSLKDKIEPQVTEMLRLDEEAMKAINAGVSAQGMTFIELAQIHKMLRDRRLTEEKLHTAFNTIDPVRFKGIIYRNEVGSSNATPCSDGERVYWVCGGGWQGGCGGFMIVCFDLEGNRLWSRYLLPDKWNEHGTHTSPVLMNGMLIYNGNSLIVALDAKTGATLWSKQDLVNSACSPVPFMIGKEPVVLFARSGIFALDGSVVCPNNISHWGDYTPVIEGRFLYNPNAGGGAGHPAFEVHEMPSTTKGDLKMRKAWTLSPEQMYGDTDSGSGYTIASPLLVNGLLYQINGFGQMHVIDTNAKTLVYRRWLDGYHRYHRWLYGASSSPSLVGKYIFATDGAGHTTIFEPGREFKLIAQNVLESITDSAPLINNPLGQECFYANPWFEGNSIYLHGDEYLYCIRE